MEDLPIANPAPKPRWRIPRRGLAVACILAAAATAVFVVFTTAYPVGSKVDNGVRWQSEVRQSALQVNSPVYRHEGDARFWIVKLGTGELLALSAEPAHPRACIIQWRPNMLFDGREGWFRDPCLGITYSLNGAKMFGPAPRGMDRYQVRVKGDDVQVLVGGNIKAVEAQLGLEPYIPRRGS